MDSLPRIPFLLTDPDLGLTPRRLRTLVARGDVRRVVTGVGVRADLEDTILLRAQAASLVLSAGQVVIDHSAAWLHGIDVGPIHGPSGPPVLEVADVRGRRATRRHGTDGCRRTIPADDVVQVNGVATTSALRTAADLACRRGRGDALAALDAFWRHHEVHAAAHRPMIDRFAGRRGVTQYRELVALADPRAESPRESVTRLAARDHGFSELEPQVDVFVTGYGWARLDPGDRARRIALEYDGADVHGKDDQREVDERRRDALVRSGWIVIVVRAGDFAEPGLSRWIGELHAAYGDRTAAGGRRWARGESSGRHHSRR